MQQKIKGRLDGKTRLATIILGQMGRLRRLSELRFLQPNLTTRVFEAYRVEGEE